MNRIALSAMGLLLAASSHGAWAQTAPPAAPAAQQPRNPFQSEPLGDGPWDIQTADAKLHVEVFATGLDHPWGLAFLPDGAMLVTERPGRLRVIRMLGQAGYSHMAMLRMFRQLDRGETRELRHALDTPAPGEADIFTAADRWLSTLAEQEERARQAVALIEEILARLRESD